MCIGFVLELEFVLKRKEMMVSFPMGRMRREENTFVEFSFVNCVLFFFVPVFDLNDSMREGGGGELFSRL